MLWTGKLGNNEGKNVSTNNEGNFDNFLDEIEAQNKFSRILTYSETRKKNKDACAERG